MPLEMHQLQKLDDYRWLVPRGTKPGMLTDALIYTDERLLGDLLKDLSLEQAINVAMLPGIVGRSLAMPDIHQGYGFPIGGVAATLPDEGGVISPGGVGFDINCGVRLLASTLTVDEVRPKIKELVNQLFRDIPSGVGQSGSIRPSYHDLDRLLEDGAAWMVEHSYGQPEDLDTCEENGAIDDADPAAVSDRAKKRGLSQVGTLGSGNHFLEVQYLEHIFDPAAAQTLGLYENEIVILIHSGSRGLGHQVCTDYLRDMDAGMRRYGIELPDRQLACVPVHSKEGQEYLAAMRASANFAWANRQGITHFARQAFKRIFGQQEELRVVYDVCHNIAKLERHQVNGTGTQSDGASQRGHSGLPRGAAGSSGRVQVLRPAGADTRLHGDGILRPGGRGGSDEGDLRHHLPWGGPGDEPHRGEEIRLRPKRPAAAGRTGHRGASRKPRWHHGGNPRGV